jgi:hypothetical protein
MAEKGNMNWWRLGRVVVAAHIFLEERERRATSTEAVKLHSWFTAWQKKLAALQKKLMGLLHERGVRRN